MMTNLFSIFDPSTPMFYSLNWLSMVLALVLTPVGVWVTHNRFNYLLTTLYNYIKMEFSVLIKKSPYFVLMSLSFMMMILWNNILGLMPFIFTATSHLSVTLPLALPCWLAFIGYSWVFNTNHTLAHLVPMGTPYLLMPLMVLIETISNIIRPVTLAVRLAANMIAGHLLMVILSSATPMTPLLMLPILGQAQLALALLETAVTFIQAYVFSVLITLYAAESVSYVNS